MIAHVGGVPVEEMLPLAASWAGAGVLFAYAGVRSRVRRPRAPRAERARDAST